MSSTPTPVLIRSAEDLDGVRREINQRMAMESPLPLEIRFETDLVLRTSLVWGNLEESPPLDITVDGGGHLLKGVQLRMEGRRVQVSHLRMDGDRRPGQLLEVVSSEEIRLNALSLCNTPAFSKAPGARTPVGALRLKATVPGVRARVQDVLLVDHRAPGAVRVGARGRGGFSELLWERGRAGGVVLPLFELGELSVFSARETVVLGSGLAVRAMPTTVVLEDPTVKAEDPVLLERWRAELGAGTPVSP